METKRLLIPLLLVFAWHNAAADAYSDGLSAYREGRDAEARAHFEQALAEVPGNDGACLYLGVLYQKAGQLGKAEEVLRRGGAIGGEHLYELAFNLGNLYYSQERYDEAQERYDFVASSLSPFRTRALLNRANMAVGRMAYQEAIDDYLNYLTEVPAAPQRGDIEKMIALLRGQIQEEEKRIQEEEDRRRREEEDRRLRAEEESRRQEEEARQQALAEERRQEEEARQRALMADILNSLSTAGDETKNFTADSEKVEENFEESDLED